MRSKNGSNLMEDKMKGPIGTFALWFAGGCLVLFVCTMLGCVLGVGGLFGYHSRPENVYISSRTERIVQPGQAVHGQGY